LNHKIKADPSVEQDNKKRAFEPSYKKLKILYITQYKSNKDIVNLKTNRRILVLQDHYLLFILILFATRIQRKNQNVKIKVDIP